MYGRIRRVRRTREGCRAMHNRGLAGRVVMELHKLGRHTGGRATSATQPSQFEQEQTSVDNHQIQWSDDGTTSQPEASLVLSDALRGDQPN